jgi:hypothetical protein
MTPGDVVDELLSDERLDSDESGAAIHCWVALVQMLRPQEQHSPLSTADVARARSVLRVLTDAVNAAAARHPSPVRPVRPGDAR